MSERCNPRRNRASRSPPEDNGPQNNGSWWPSSVVLGVVPNYPEEDESRILGIAPSEATMDDLSRFCHEAVQLWLRGTNTGTTPRLRHPTVLGWEEGLVKLVSLSNWA